MPKDEGYKTDITIELCKEVSKGSSVSKPSPLSANIIIILQMIDKVIL